MNWHSISVLKGFFKQIYTLSMAEVRMNKREMRKQQVCIFLCLLIFLLLKSYIKIHLLNGPSFRCYLATCLDQAFSNQTNLSVSHALPLALVLLVSTSMTDVLITTLSSLPDHQRSIGSMKKAALSSRKSQREILLLSDSTLGEATNLFQLQTSRNSLG